MSFDEHLFITRLKQDDEKAFETLYYYYHAKVYNLGRRFLSRKEDSEEVVQVVFVALWENRYQIDENKSLTSYILSIARHTIFNILRKNVYKQGYIEFIIKQDPTLDFVTENEILFNDLNKFLAKIIEQLPEKRKEIFLLSRREGLSYKEISTRLSISESTVNTQLTKALEFIRKNINLWY